MGLLQDEALALDKEKGSLGKALLTNESFEHTYGRKSRRKRMNLDQLFTPRTCEFDKDPKPDKKDVNTQHSSGGNTTNVEQRPDSEEAAYGALLAAAQKSSKTYENINSRDGEVPWGKDSNLVVTSGEGVDWHAEKKDDLFLKGQSKRIWGEFYKVVDCSDIILHVIDARNVPGTRCRMIEEHISKNASHKHLVFILNKIDLVPNWVVKRWIGELAAVRPTIAFHASATHAFGKGALISLLRQFGKLYSDKKQISVGVVGYPNVGKSSVINTIISKKSCKVAPIPGETKIWQYVTLFKNIYLIDCPGVVVDSAGDTEIDSVLKGVVRAERLKNPEGEYDNGISIYFHFASVAYPLLSRIWTSHYRHYCVKDFVDAIMDAVRREHIAAHYGIPKDGKATWKNGNDLMEMIAKKTGRLLKGGEPCLRSSAIYLINDFQRGRLPHFVGPPELKDDGEIESSEVKLPSIAAVDDSLDDAEKKILKDMKKDSFEMKNKIDSDCKKLEREEECVSSDEECDENPPCSLISNGNWDDQ